MLERAVLSPDCITPATEERRSEVDDDRLGMREPGKQGVHTDVRLEL